METVTRKIGDVRWTIRSQWVGWVESIASALIRNLDTAEGVKQIKKKSARGVWRVDQNGTGGEEGPGAVYIKWAKGRTALDGFRNIVISSRLAIEWDRALRLADMGVVVPSPIAYAERRSGGRFQEEWMISEEVVGRSLAEIMKSGFPKKYGIDPGTVGRWARDLHDKGVEHTDFHSGNVLLTDEGVLVLLDLHDVLLGPPLDVKTRARNMARLLRWEENIDPGLVFEPYVEFSKGPGSPMNQAKLLKAFLKERATEVKRYNTHRIAKSLRKSNRFSDQVHADRRIRTFQGVDPDEVVRSWDEARPQLREDVDVSVTIDGQRATWHPYSPSGLADKVFAGLGSSEGVRAWLGSFALKQWGIGGPNCLALVRPGRLSGAFGRCDLLVLETGEVPLENMGSPALGGLLAKLHEAGLTFRGDLRSGDFAEFIMDKQSRVGVTLGGASRLRLVGTVSSTDKKADIAGLVNDVSKEDGIALKTAYEKALETLVKVRCGD